MRRRGSFAARAFVVEIHRQEGVSSVVEDRWLDVKEQVRQATNIVDLVSGYMQLRRSGRDYVGLCPWHNDTNPSFRVNPERQSFKCWVCDVGGDVFSFMMRMESVEFREALEMLADRAGISIQAAGQGGTSSSQRRDLFQVMEWAQNAFHKMLTESPEGETAREYLQQRGINQQSIDRFRIGFAPDQWDWLLKGAIAAGISPESLHTVGLVKPREGGSGFYDRFRGRVQFPIHDSQGRPIAVGGRILPQLQDPDKEQAKYINSPETPLFSKSNQVYALDLARHAISKQKNVIVVEGYTDCIMAHQQGVENVIAVLGTALGQRHIQILKRYADWITLVLDGDEAGRKRTNQILELFIAEQADLRILTLPQNTDPCDFLRAHGGDAFQALVEKARDALEHKIHTVTAGLDIVAETHQASEALEEVLETLAHAPESAGNETSAARLREHQFLARLARVFRVDEQHVRERLRVLRRGRKTSFAKNLDDSDPAQPSQLDYWDRDLLELVLLDPDSLEWVGRDIAPEDLSSDIGRLLYKQCLEIFSSGGHPSFERLMLITENPQIKSLLVRLEEHAHAKADIDVASRLEDIVYNFCKRREDARHRSQIAELQEGNIEANQQSEILGDLLASLRTRQNKPDPTDG